ncbi:MAG: tetratricopeptide repeat protein [Kamptonema sp. SIO1D9]|nr:tetratricopeptide repeat protein [Kamptonema sp. SIO1D9]
MPNLQPQLLRLGASVAGATVYAGAGAFVGGLTGAALAAVSGIIGGHAANEFGALAALLPDSDDELLANHHLSEAVGLAIAAIIEDAAQTHERLTYIKPKLTKLAKCAIENWQQVAQQTEADFTSLSEAQILALFSHEAAEFQQVTALNPESWEKFLQQLCHLVALKFPINPEYFQIIAKKLHTDFPKALREVLKKDAATGGKAYPRLILDFAGKITTQLQQIETQQSAVFQQIETLTPQHLPNLLSRVETGLNRAIETIIDSFTAEEIKDHQERQTEAHHQAITYYRKHTKPRQQWKTLADVQEYLEIFYHFCELGDYKSAFNIIRDDDYSDDCVDNFLNLGGYNQIRVELYTQLITNWQPEDRENWRYTASLTSLGNAYDSLGEYQRAIEFHQQSLEIFREIGDRSGEANSVNNLGNAYYSLGEYQRAIEFHQQSLEIFREIGDRSGEANSVNNLGNAYYSLGEYQRAIEFHQQSLEIKRAIGDRGGEANSLGNLGNAYHSLGEYQRVIEFHQQSLEIKRAIGDRGGEANSLYNLGISYKSLSEYQTALISYQQALEVYEQLNLTNDVIDCLNQLGSVCISLKRYPEALDFYQQLLEIKREREDKQGEANCLLAMADLYEQTGSFQKGFALRNQAHQILMEIGGWEALPQPQWLKSSIRFAQQGKIQLAVCFVVGLVAFPFALVALILLVLWRLLRARLRR